MIDNETIKTLLERRSCKAFLAQQISDEELNTVLEAGRFAPTAMNRQPTLFIAVQEKALMEKIAKMNAAVMGRIGENPYYDAPTVVLVLCKRTITTGVSDASLAIGNMLNAAYSIGLGSCWVNREEEMFDSDEGKNLLMELGIDGDWLGVGSCILGYPAAENPEVRPRTNIVKIIK